MPTYPVRLCGSPLYLVDLPLSSGVSQNWVLDSPRHLLDVPDQGLDMEEEGMIRNIIIIYMNISVTHVYQVIVASSVDFCRYQCHPHHPHLVIIAGSADMARGMGGPGNAIHTGAVVI